ncbi:hypothetical protein CYMTET_52500 [Cymbomonas tetramitiformis]|uniref:DUF2237 domain-containing protein n=1 Tax=Cymbomonas tetramitiformis TaxID=36881 RepID=A0AAE0BJ48_9CHLO|nr:hypothetical protein CYMTET_52500 [Cymbomonas tetramitiformis]
MKSCTPFHQPYLPCTSKSTHSAVDVTKVAVPRFHAVTYRRRGFIPVLFKRKSLTTCSNAPGPSPYDGPGVSPSRNVLGGELECCCAEVRDTGVGTGYFRDGFCSTGPSDDGRHTVCVEVTAEFLAFCRAVGNNLSTPIPQYSFPGLLPGDKWCLVALRWAQAKKAGMAPKVYLRATHEATLQYITLEELKEYAVDLEEAEEDLKKLSDLRSQLESSFGTTDE